MSVNWYARRLSGGTFTPRESSPQATVPAPAPTPVPAPTPHTRRPQSALQTEHCPSCGSSNYMAAQGSKLHRCLECGYPVVQSGSGVGSGGRTDGTVRAAKQPETGTYSPTTIVGRIN